MDKYIKNTPLAIAMATAIPLWIMRFQEVGGPTDEQFKRATSEASYLLAEYGDILLYSSSKGHKKKKSTKPTTAEVFNRTAEAIAAMAFLPGGIDIFGMHFEAKK